MYDEERATSSLRFTLGDDTTDADVTAAASALTRVVSRR
jgi:cysteine sulfinate desulfinase/cysteine desulfurase-like protein